MGSKTLHKRTSFVWRYEVLWQKFFRLEGAYDRHKMFLNLQKLEMALAFDLLRLCRPEAQR
jgi:hypothetical protein